ncbi:type I-E CRISPR-associated protein Cse1/CasA [Streptomyces lavendulocolor]|uniref:type I-E CRISPR-associated protein Cse1/CasA n=1 Tax=Streptomyces lavendulocolor TaxID=67316 RepID=UPI0033F03CF2
MLYLDGTQAELSLREVFAQAGRIRRLVGELPTVEFALLRLLLAVCHDALDGPGDVDEWADLWDDERCFAPVAGYLDSRRTRFDLLHPLQPFMQVAGLRTAKDEVFSLNRIVADVPNGEPFFSSRQPSVQRLPFAEAARWLIHTHAYDTSGIKTGVAGDDRAKGGKVYPLGVGWAGTLGGVFAEGDTLRQTLLLNLIADDAGGGGNDHDRPAWRHDPCGPSAVTGRRPGGVRDLYTWQSRRVRLHFDADGVHGVVLGYGDPFAPHNQHRLEPMTAWRRSAAQEKKRGEAVVYLPREHDPSRAAWRGLAALIVDRVVPGQGAEAAPVLRPGVLEWVARLVTEGVLPRGFLIRARVVGAVYGTQQSVIDEVVDDHVAMALVLLHRQDRDYAVQAIDAVSDAEKAVLALGDLASDLARAAGSEAESMKVTAQDRGFGALDHAYRTWLQHLAAADDPFDQRRLWQQQAHRTVRTLGEELLRSAGEAAWEGRLITTKAGTEWLNAALAEAWFRARLNKALSHPFTSPESSGEAVSVPALLPEVSA